MFDLFGLNTFSVYLSLVFKRFYDPTERLIRILLSAHLLRERIRETRNGFSLLHILRSCTKFVSSHLIDDLLQTGVTVTFDMYTFLPACRLKVTKY